MGNGYTIDHYGAGENKKMKKDEGWYIRNCMNQLTTFQSAQSKGAKMKIVTVLVLLCISIGAGARDLSDEQIKKIIIQQSIGNYSGNCPCPYNVTRNGSVCGRRSAYSRAGGYAPICYPNDVTQGMINRFKSQSTHLWVC